MAFVYLHILWFGSWIGFGVEKYPYAGCLRWREEDRLQRADAKRQVLADQQWQTVKEEDRQNVQLLELSNQILDLTKAVHAYAARADHAQLPGLDSKQPANQ
jgi:hypothetical protein